MRKSSYPSLENCNIIANKIFGISLAELQQEGQPDHEVPFIVRHIVNYIEVHGGLEQEGLFQVNGNAETVEWLRQRYDNGEEVDLVKEADVPSAISLLRHFLQELPQPIILHSLHHRFMQLSQDFDNENEFSKKLQYLLQQLPPINYSLLKFLCRFLANVASNHEEMWPTTALAAVFGPDLFHIYSDDDMKDQEIVTKIMTGLLEGYCDYFETEEEFSSNNISSITEQNNDLQKEEHAEVTSEECFEVEPNVTKVDISEDLLELNDVIGSTRQDISVDNANIESDDTEYSEPLISGFSEHQDAESISVFSYLGQEQTQVSDILLEITDEQTNYDGVMDKDIFSESLDKPIDDSYRPHSPAMDSSNCDYNANLEFEMSQASVSSRCETVSIHHLELRNISSDDLEEPFPDFKSWQQDLEYGEAQLSPQAGRINNYVEEDTNPVRSHRSLDFGQRQRFLHNPESNCSSMTFYFRTRKASFSSKDDKREDKTPYQLVKKFHKKIRQYEEQFEIEKNDKPTYNDIAANPKVLKWMTDLTKLKRQMKDTKHKNLDEEFLPQTRPRSNTLPKSFGSSLQREEEEDGTKAEKKPSKEATVELILKRLEENRTDKGLPEKINMKMSKDNLAEEKTSLQKSLLYYESLHGRPVTREERQIVKPLYDRYRLVKQMLARATITPILGSPSLKRRAQILPPIIEGETSHFFDDIKQEEEDESSSLFSDSGDNTCIMEQSLQRQDDETPLTKHQVKLSIESLSSSRTTSMTELIEQLWKTKAEKKKLRQSLREFEEEFHRQNGRFPMFLCCA
ncbi:protein FAM13B isoform X2 [Xenopus laevis]|uniref:Protein FAM13B isoform X2 n=1 Tax=Xenopus laevis TaxID=8355 RepID=A0A8J1MSE8_XENLA|nr:protein FAM13B isoform X2 [Xenopus laevis]